jgi:inward rectifier potassium channel
VVTSHNGQPTVMVRLVNGRTTPMTSANARVFILLSERSAEGLFYRRVHELVLAQSHLPLFIMPWTLMHRIDPSSPLHGRHAEALTQHDTRVFVSIEARDRVLDSVVGDMRPYEPRQIRFGMRYADAVILDPDGKATADIGRISLIEPDSESVAEMSQ